MRSQERDARTDTRICGELGREGETGPSIITIKAYAIGSRRASMIVERSFRGLQTKGWDCHSAGTEGTCRKGRARIAYRGTRGVRGCGQVGFKANSDSGAGHIRTKRAPCRVARRVARGSRSTGPINPTGYRVAGFSCRGRQIEGTLPSSLFVCHRKNATVVFSRT